jgi:DNA-directed RNA polymerase II subunit RPB2
MADYSLNEFLEDFCLNDVYEGTDEKDNIEQAEHIDTTAREDAVVHNIAAVELGSIDPTLGEYDMIAYLYAELKSKGIAGHHLSSMNSFYSSGIKQITTGIFSVDGRLNNQRDNTEEDKRISEITFHIEFTDINLRKPTTIKYKSGKPQMLTPTMARLKSLTYSASMYIDANISATALYKDGTTKTRTAEIKDFRIGAIPCMVGSELCNTYGRSREDLKKLGEDPTNPRANLIIKGLEWTIDSLENIANNTFHVHKNMYGKEIARGTFLSKPGDGYENSYQVILRYLTTGAITLEITTSKFDKLEIPFYVLFRALGMTADYDVLDHIVYGVENSDIVTKTLVTILHKAFGVTDERFAYIHRNTVPSEIVAFIGQKITENAEAARKDDNVAKYLNNNILSIFDRYIFPHIGTAVTHRVRKLRFLGHLINTLLRVVIGVLDSTDRDHQENKRVATAGITSAKIYKTNVNLAVIQPIKKALIKIFKSTPFSQVPLAETVKAAINADDLERMLTTAIVSSAKPNAKPGKLDITTRISSQMLYHKNALNVIGTLRVVNSPNSSSSNKQTERADKMRRVHPSYLGFICPSKSADTGPKVGTTKDMGISASICIANSSYNLRQTILSDPDIIDIDSVTPAEITTRKLAKVLVNGNWIACCLSAHFMARQYRAKRRANEIHHLVTIYWKPLGREIYFWTDAGRLMRPLIIVYNNLEAYINARRAGDTEYKFQQWIKLTSAHIEGLRSGRLSTDDLRKEGIIEYIAPGEQTDTFIAPNINELRKHVNDITKGYSHCDVSQAIFGITALSCPMANHSSATRVTYFTNHRKQSAGWFALNYPYRIDKNTTLQVYCDRPLVSTFTNALTLPNGQNIIVALAIHGGRNQEDSITVNESSINCGMFNSIFYTFEKAELEKGEQFGNPDMATTMDIKRDASYEHIENGFVKEGTKVKKGDVIIVKAAKIPKPTDSYTHIDRSVVYKKIAPATVEKVIVSTGDDGTTSARVKYSTERVLGVGDKLSSLSGNKGICSNTIPRCDMMYGEDGLVPDIVVNAHSFPTRMALNQICEGLLGMLAIKRGSHIDATSFISQDFDAIISMLHELGSDYMGHRRMYNGATGEYLDTLIFVCPNTYQRLLKFAADEIYATRVGPTSALTHQPLDGKTNDGGLRMGEMEKDGYCGQGCMRALNDKFYKDSDALTIYVCKACGNRAIVNEKLSIYKCKYCKDNADIVSVDSSWVANLFFNEASAANIRMLFEVDPHSYPHAYETA